jgi:NodT family efflux transporter outer membrane factor (OMF) lipoprotein
MDTDGRHAGVLAAIALVVAGCTVGPNYKKPPVTVPPAFKEAATPEMTSAAASQLAPAQPQDATSRGQWWSVFNDPQLDGLEQQVALSNQTVAQAAARFAAARAAVLGARSGLYPTVTAGASATRSQGSASRVITGAAASSGSSVGTTTGSGSTAGRQAAAVTVTGYQLPIDFTYELDLWGRVRRGVEASIASAQASAADLATATLSMQSELALDYFQVRGLDAEKQLLDSTVAGYVKALQLTQLRHNQGIASGVDVAQAETQLATVRAQSTDLGVQRAQFEHAIAVLVGKPPALFALPASQAAIIPPAVPSMLPAQLLQRRPDIAAAERTVAAANAQIGVAKAAYFPTVGISASGGLASSTLSTLLSWPSRFWSLGPSLVETVFEGGRRRSATLQATAGWEETVAAYRQTVLSAFEDVEDNLAASRILGQEVTEQAAAVEAAQRALDLANSRYQGGITTYLEVITAQAAALSNERAAIQLLTRRMVADVLLVKAIGGGWNVSDLPAARAVAISAAK